MKKITIKYSIEIPEDDLNKYAMVTRLGRKVVIKELKGVAENFGRDGVYSTLRETNKEIL